jgi:hypothetical protein
LAAFGALQICDNKTGLGQIFSLGHEAIGYDTVPEAIELTHYFLKNEDERLRITHNAYQRFWKEYNATAIWQRIYSQLKEWEVDEHRPIEKATDFHPRKTARDSLTPGLYYMYRSAKRLYALTRPLLFKIKSKRKTTTRYMVDERVYVGEKVMAYHENPEMKGINKAQERLISGKPLDWPNILALNWAITSLIGNAKQIVEIGSGTGPFAEYASVDSERMIDCFEEDDFARNKAMEIRPRQNVNYYKTYEGHLASNYDLLVSVEVIEHVANLKGFLEFCSKLAPRAIFTTPNRNVVRDTGNTGPPNYPPHVREFTPGEIYWILKLFYKTVYLFYMPDVNIPWLVPMTIVTPGTPIIAECCLPY